MGGAFSCGENNDDLVNTLLLLGYIRSKKVEKVFRAVDRGNYLPPEHRDIAYKDLSFKLGNIHLSAPCVYCRVMEGLTLKPGLSFLNIGSGTGYLSTMAGLILGKNGTNHGIEMHEDCIIYADENLEIFKEKSLDVDSFEFCEPVFQLGNIFNVAPNRRYDRVYCGASCPEVYEQYIKQFVKVGGILVMPYKDNLLRIERLNENTWRNTTMLPVSFATLVTPLEGRERGFLQLPLWQPCDLQELCRSRIRSHLRKLVWSENSDLEFKAPLKAQPIQRTVPQLGIPFFESFNRAHRREEVTSTLRLVRAVVQLNQESENCDETSQEAPTSGDSAGTAPSGSLEGSNHTPMESDDLMDAESSEKQENTVESTAPLDIEMEDCESDQKTPRSTRSLDSKFKKKIEAIGPHAEPHNSQRYHLSDKNEDSGESSGAKASASSSEPPASISDSEEQDEEDALDFAWIGQAFSILKDKFETEINGETSDSAFDISESSSRVEFLPVAHAVPDSDENEENALGSQESRENQSRTYRARNLRPKDGNGKKSMDFEAVQQENENTKVSHKSDSNSESTSDEEFVRGEYRRTARSGRKRRSEQRSDTSGSYESSNITYTSHSNDSTDSDTDCDFNFPYEGTLQRNVFAHTVRKEKISHFMQKKISSLPLPLPLRLYVNYNREL